MKRTAFVIVAVLTLLASFSVPARANGAVQGRTFSIALAELPPTCPTAATMEGRGAIQLNDDGTNVAKPVHVRVTVDTPFGDAVVFSQSFKVRPGTTRVVPISIPVPERTPAGEYDFTFTVTVKGETLSVSHEVQIYNPF